MEATFASMQDILSSPKKAKTLIDKSLAELDKATDLKEANAIKQFLIALDLLMDKVDATTMGAYAARSLKTPPEDVFTSNLNVAAEAADKGRLV